MGTARRGVRALPPEVPLAGVADEELRADEEGEGAGGSPPGQGVGRGERLERWGTVRRGERGESPNSKTK